MSSITDVGVNFRMTGMEDFENRLKSIESQFKSFSETVGKAPDVGGHFKKMDKHFEALHTNISGALRKTELAIGAFLTGKAIKGLSDWVLGGSGAETDQMKDFLRIHGTTEEGLKNFSQRLDELAAQRPLDKLSAWSAAENMNSMLGGLDDPKLTDRLLKANSNLAAMLDVTGNMSKAMDMATPFIAGFGGKEDAAGKVKLFEELNKYIKYVTDRTQLKGPDIQNILPQVIGPYLGAGKSPAEMFSHIAILDFLRGQSGEVLKSLFSKEGKALGGIGAELDKGAYIAQLRTDPGFFRAEQSRIYRQHQEVLKPNIRSEADLPDAARAELQKQVSNRAKEYEALGGRLLAQGDTRQYADLILDALNKLKALQGVTGKSVNAIISEHFGETSIKGIYPLLEAIVAGRDKKMMREMEAYDVSNMTADFNNKYQSLTAKKKTFENVAGGISSDFRKILEPGAIEVFGSWQASLESVRKQIQDLKQESQVAQNIKEGVGGIRGGFLDAYYGQGAADQAKALDEAIVGFAKSLAEGGWAETGRQLGTAVGKFASVLEQAGEIVGWVHKAVSKFMNANDGGSSGPSMLGPLATGWGLSQLGDKWWQKAVLFGLGWTGGNLFFNGRDPGSQLNDTFVMSDQMKMYKPRQLQDSPVHRPGGHFMAPTMQPLAQEGASLPPVTINGQARVTVELDGNQIKETMIPMVQEEIQKGFESRRDKRGNANDGWVSGFDQ